MEFKGQVDKRMIYLLLGCYCNNPRLAIDDKYSTTIEDYPESFHRMIWGAIVNIAKKRLIHKITSMDIDTELSSFEKSYKLWKDNDGWEYIENAIEDSKDKELNIDMYRDTVRKYSIIRSLNENLKMDISYLYDEMNDTVMERFNSMSSNDIIREINNKFIEFKTSWNTSFSDGYSFHVGDNIDDTVNEYKNQENTYGYPFQSGYMTTVYRGMRKKKFIIRSSPSGCGKSRNSMAESCNIATDKIYDWKNHKWISTGEKYPVLYISTELSKEEIQSCLLAHVSGVDQDRLEMWDITEEEEKIIMEAKEIIKECHMYGEYMPDFTIDSINDKIEEYVINYGIEYAFFDYINDSPSLYAFYFEKTKMRLRTDQVLFMFSDALKATANKYDIYLGSSTQVNDSYKKEEENKDSSSLKGSKAIIEKADGGILALPVTEKDLIKLKPILESKGNFGNNIPNMAYHVFKNRGGRWNNIIIWTKLNLGTVRELDCFVTNKYYELVTEIEKTLIEFQLDDVGDVGLIECEGIDDLDVNGIIDELMENKK